MQSYLTTRYRRVHEKIKDVRLPELRAKLAKDMYGVTFQPILSKLSSQLLLARNSTRIQAPGKLLPYIQQWRKSALLKYCIIAVITSTPIIYKLQSPASNIEAHINELMKQNDDVMKRTAG